MKNGIYIITSVFIGLILVGCNPHNINVPEAKDYNQTLLTAWESYDNLDFSTAISKFDTVVLNDAYSTEALLGLGWSYGQLGDLEKARSFLSLSITSQTDTPPLLRIYAWHPDSNLISFVHPEYDTTLSLVSITVPDSLRPVVGVGKFYVKGDYRKWIIYSFTDSNVVVRLKYSSVSSSSYLFDSSYVDIIVLRDFNNLPKVFLDAYAGLSATYSALSDYTNSIPSALLVIKNAPSYAFEHYPYRSVTDIEIDLAMDYLRAGLNLNAIWLLQALDSSWSFDYTHNDPYTITAMEEILTEITKLKGIHQ